MHAWTNMRTNRRIEKSQSSNVLEVGIRKFCPPKLDLAASSRCGFGRQISTDAWLEETNILVMWKSVARQAMQRTATLLRPTCLEHEHKATCFCRHGPGQQEQFAGSAKRCIPYEYKNTIPICHDSIDELPEFFERRTVSRSRFTNCKCVLFYFHLIQSRD